MKKILSFMLVLTLTLSVCSFAAFAEDDEPLFSGYIALDHTNADGSPQYVVDPQWGAVVSVSDVIYDGYGGEEDEIEGISYSADTNTLTLSGLQAADKILRLTYFPENVNIAVNGSCRIGSIETWRAGLNITGTGSLVINENEFYDEPIRIDADKTECTLCFGEDVSVTVYESGGESACAAVITRAPGGTADKHFFFAAEHNGSLKEAFNTREEHIWITGYKKKYDDKRTTSLGSRMIRKSDPEGVYAGYWFTEEDGARGVVYKKFVYVESLGGYLPDPSFSDSIYEAIYGGSMYEDAFEDENCDYRFVVDEEGETTPLENPFDYQAFVNVPVMVDAQDNKYAVGSVYNNETGTLEKRVATFEPIDGMDGFYRFTPVEGMTDEGLEAYNGDETSVTGYLITEPDASNYIAEKVIRTSDPDTVYGYTRRWFPEEGERDCIVRYVYDETLDTLFEDESFEPVFVDDGYDFFENNEEWQLVRNANGATQWITYDGFWLDRRDGPVYQDGEGNRYMVERFYEDEQETITVYTYEPIGVLEDRYFFTLAEGVDFDALTECVEEVQQKDEVNFILTGADGVFLYNGASSGYTLSGTIKSFLAEQNNHAEIKVYKEGEETPVASKVLEGTVSAYRINGLEAGKYTVKVDKAYHIDKEFTVEISDDTVLNTEIYPLGDITLSGKVDIKDVNAAYKHTKEQPLITDEYALSCGDVKKNGKVDIKDVNALYKHVKEITLLY